MAWVDGDLAKVEGKGGAGPPDTGLTGMALARMERARCLAVLSSSTDPNTFPVPSATVSSNPLTASSTIPLPLPVPSIIFGLAPMAS